MPGASATSIKNLDVRPRQASRTITGCVMATPVGELDREAGLEPFGVRRRMMAGDSSGKTLSRPARRSSPRTTTTREQTTSTPTL